jgi:hypothetical protein
MLDIIGAAVLLAFGMLVVYFSLEEGISDEKLMLILIAGVICIVAGLWILITKITLAVILKKLGGLILTGVGLFLIVGFPDISEYQSSGMSTTGIFIGLILFFIGIWFLFF